MLATLKRVLHQIDSADDLFELLKTVLGAIENEIHFDASYLFLYDEEKKSYISPTFEDLTFRRLGELAIPQGKGLVSLIAQRSEPLNVADASIHPHYYAEAENRSEIPLHGFLGVPIIHRKQTLGVITVQKQQKACFEPEEEAFLLTLCIQIAGTLAQAKLAGHFADLMRNQTAGKKSENIIITGIPCVKGIGIGTSVIIYPQANLDAVPDQSIADIEGEYVHFNEAVSTCKKEILHLQERLAQSLPAKELVLFEAYISVLEDTHFLAEIQTLIGSGLSAQTALRRVIKSHRQAFLLMDDTYLREREADFRSLGQRLLACLQAQKNISKTYPHQTILVGDEISAADLAEVPHGRLVGIVSGQGSVNSHVAILARALGIPAILGVEGLPLSDLDKQKMIIDGNTGQVFVAVSDSVLAHYIELQKEEQTLKTHLKTLRDLPAETLDGHRVNLRVNVGLTINRGSSLQLNAEGVGLFRSEIAFLGRERFPTEEEQRIIYRQLLQAFAPRPVVIRTLDIGGDKRPSYFFMAEDNPALGWRGIRITLDHPEVFMVQMRAILRASQGLSNLEIMFPMISQVQELNEAKYWVERAFNELSEEGLSLTFPKIGMMVEVPAVIYQLPHFLPLLDFISVGTNDLIQYLLAVDRDNAYVAHLYQSLHPAVLQALYQIALMAHQHQKSLSICGEMASDPYALPLLVAMGYECLSMHSANVLQVKAAIRRFSLAALKNMLTEALVLDQADKIKALVHDRCYSLEMS